METIWREAGDHAVVADETILAQKYGVFAAAGGERLKISCVHQTQERGGVWSNDLDLSECGGIEQAKIVAYRATFAGDGGMHGFAGLGKIPGAFPGARVFEHRVAIVDRGAADGIEQVPARGAGEGAEGHGRVRRAERGQADLRDRPSRQRGNGGQRVQIGGFALVCRHAGGRVTFDMFDRTEPLARRDGEVLGGHIVLEIHEREGMRRGGQWRRGWAEARFIFDQECPDLAAARAVSRREAGGKVEFPRAGANGHLRRGGFSRQKHAAFGIEAQFSARLGE